MQCDGYSCFVIYFCTDVAHMEHFHQNVTLKKPLENVVQNPHVISVNSLDHLLELDQQAVQDQVK